VNISGFQGFDLAASAAEGLRARMAELNRQVASGQRADSYAGLGGDALRAIDLRADLARRETYVKAAEQGAAFCDVAQLALGKLSDTTLGMIGNANRLLANGLPLGDAAGVAFVARSARAALQDVVGTLGERYAGEALFGGADPLGTPVVAPEGIESTQFHAAIGAAVRGLGPGNGQAVLDATKTIAQSDTNDIFTGHAALAAQGAAADSRRAVPVGEGVTIEIGLYAYRNAAAASRGETTGSWARDMLRGLAILANLEPGQEALGGDYDTLVRGAIASLRAGLDGVTEEAAALGGQQQRLDSAQTRNREFATQLEVQVGKVEQVDMAETITRLQATQAQLEASYRCLAMLGELSLTNFLR
jgi:flagellin-like hook-associated protein FlgL